MTAATTKKVTKFSVEYFKPSGKFYTEATFEWAADYVGETVVMHHAAAYIRGLRDSGGQGAMPGLSDQSEGWDGFIRINHPDGFPVLILPQQ
jgi:hypothetical protein